MIYAIHTRSRSRSRLAWYPLLLAGAASAIACAPPSWPPAPPPKRVDIRGPRIEPQNPIEGEHMKVLVPYVMRDDCNGIKAKLRLDGTAGARRLIIEVQNKDACPFHLGSGPSGGSLYDAPPLAAGQYVLVAGSFRRTFTVRPRSASPGPVPLHFRISLAVARKFRPGACFGMPPAKSGERGWARLMPRLTHQIQAANPTWNAEQIDKAINLARRVKVRHVKGDTYRYRFSDGRCCDIEEKIGTVRVRPNGEIAIEAPYTLSKKNVPC